MHPARKPLATIAITLGTFLIMLGAPALAGADDDNAVDLDASALAQTAPSVELAAADDTDGAAASDGAPADGAAVVGVGVAVAADSVAADSASADGVAVSGDAVVGAGIAVAADSAIADGGTDTDGASVVGTDQAGQNGPSGQNGENSQNGDDAANGDNSAGADTGNSTGPDSGGEPSPAANDPIFANNNAGVSPTTLAAQNTDRDLPEAGGPASMLILMSGFGLIIAGVVVLSHGRVRVGRHRAA